MKRISLVGAALLAPLFLFAGCVQASALPLKANWYANTNNLTDISGTRERLTYDLSFSPAEPAGEVTAEYHGTLVTELENMTVTADKRPEGLAVGFTGYHLRSETTLAGVFSLNGEKGESFEADTIVSDVWFTSAAEGLRPVRSVKSVDIHIPNSAASSASELAVRYTYTFTAAYNEAVTRAELTLAESGKEEVKRTLSLGSGGNFFDNEEIAFALRALTLTGSLSFRTVDPARMEEADIINFAAAAAVKQETNFLMGDKTVTEVDGMRISYGYGGDNGGQAQTAVYAVCTNPEENLYRNVLLRLETSALYGLGTFTYELKEAQFAQK